MIATDAQVETVSRLRGEIETIELAARNPAAVLAAQSAQEVSYSFGFFSNLSPLSSAEKTVAGIVASIHSTLARLAPVATIETSADGLMARSVITYTGQVSSVWQNAANSAAADTLSTAHLESLQKAYALRVAFAGAIAAVGSALASISLAVLNPLTVLRALASARALEQALERLAAAVQSSG